MTWVKLDDQFASHPKAIAAGPEPMWLYVAGLCWCAQHLTDGRIPKAAVPMLAAVKRNSAATLVRVGLWIDQGDEYEVNDYLDFQPSRDSVESRRDKDRDRQREWRNRHIGSNDATPTAPSPSRPVPPESSSSSSEPVGPPPADDDEVLEALARLKLDLRIHEVGPVSNVTAWINKAKATARADLNGQVGDARGRWPDADAAQIARYLFDGTKPASPPKPVACPDCGEVFPTLDERYAHDDAGCEVGASSIPTSGGRDG